MAHNSRHIRVGCVPPNLPLNSLYSPFLLHLTAKPLIETNFQYNRTTNNMTDATKSYVVDSFPTLPTFLLLPFALSTQRQKVSLFMSDHLFCHTVRAQLPNLAKYPFFSATFICAFLLLPLLTPPSTSCCFRNFMLLTNLSLSGLLFTQGSPQAPRHPFSIAFNVLVADD